MDWLRQTVAVTAIGLETLPQRRGASLVIVVGMACAVGALIAILSLSAGLTRVIERTGSPDHAVILAQGSTAEGGNAISRTDADVISDAPGVARGADGKPVISAEALAYAVVPKKSDGGDAFLTVRGVGPQNSALRPQIKLISGRMFQPGRHEVIVGKTAQAQFDGLAEGEAVPIAGGDWTITGTFESGGDIHESTLLTDAATLLSSMRLQGYSGVTAKLRSPADFTVFRKSLMSNPALAVEVDRESELLARSWSTLNGLLSTIAYFVGGIMGLGALFGALNTMYSAVSTRTAEIGTLRAIGFGGTAVMASVLAEALLLAVTGALLGALFAWLLFNGNLHAVGGVAIRLAVSQGLVLRGVIFACVLGLLGGFFPALRAARLPVATAIRAT